MLFSQLQSAVTPGNQTEALSSSAVKASNDLNAAFIVALSSTGYTSRMVAKYRPACPILTVTANDQTARQTLVSRGQYPIIVGSMVGSDAIISKAAKIAEQLGIAKSGDMYITTSGMKEGTSGGTNVLRVGTIA